MNHEQIMTCVEEAAHAVACHVLGVPISYASVVPETDIDVPTSGHMWHRRTDPDKQIMIGMAGALAQRRVDPDHDPDLRGHDTDVKTILAADQELLPHYAHQTHSTGTVSKE